jgi:hypothetical protein
VLGGAVTFRLLQRHAPLTTRFTHALVSLLLSGCSPAQGRQKENLRSTTLGRVTVMPPRRARK